MGNASFVQTDFRGGEWSQASQGNITDPRYKTALAYSYNGFPTEEGAWTRRGGTQFNQTTRNGAPGRLISFAFEQSQPYTLEFTAGYLRFFDTNVLARTNDNVTISAISTANPAVVQTAAAHGWTGTIQCRLLGLGAGMEPLQNRVFVGTVVDTTHVSLSDPITGLGIDGATSGTFSAGTIGRVLEIVSPYIGTDWLSVREVQTEKTMVLLQNGYPPYSLKVSSGPTELAYATFTLSPSVFRDGPYYDPVRGGATVTPSATNGIITLTINFPTYSASQVYSKGDYVVSSTVNYQSLVDQNLNHTPASSPAFWKAVSAGIAVGPNGFVATDVGRHVRLFSEPVLWTAGTSYAVGNVVAYVDTNGNTAYYTCLTANTAALANAPGVSLATWGINANGAIWSWGKITALASQISNSLSGIAAFGDTTSGGGNIAALDGNTVKPENTSAYKQIFQSVGSGILPSVAAYVGVSYAGTTPSSQVVTSASIVPSFDYGLVYATPGNPTGAVHISSIVVNLRAKQTPPASGSDGTLLGTTTLTPAAGAVTTTSFNPVTVQSNDTTTAWKYIWFEIIANTNGFFLSLSAYATINVAQIQLFNTASGNGSVVSMEILGPALLYTTPVRVWRMGLYNQASVFPSCGTYHEGRLWLSGNVPNRFDASEPITIDPDGTIPYFSFAPTARDGSVTDSNAISYTLNAKQSNKILWMETDQQGIIMGTQTNEWLVQATTLNQPLTPTSIQAHPVTKIGTKNAVPARTEHTLLFIHKFGRKIMEYFADFFSGKLSAPNLAENARHLTVPGIAEIAYQQELTPILWARNTDGSLKGMTYKRVTLTASQPPAYNGWHQHGLGSGRTVESLVVGPSVGGNLDAPSFITTDAATGIRHVETLSDIFTESDVLTDAWFLDDAVTPSSYKVTVVAGGASGIQCNGLWHLNGKTVTVFAGGLDCGDWPVANGNLQVPFAPSSGQGNALFTAAFVAAYSGAMPIVVGFTYASRGQIVSPLTVPESGSRNGPGFGKVQRIHKFAMDLIATQGISIGASFTRLHKASLMTRGGTVALADNALFSGIYKDTLDDDANGFGTEICWETSRPLPTTVNSVGGFVQTTDE